MHLPQIGVKHEVGHHTSAQSKAAKRRGNLPRKRWVSVFMSSTAPQGRQVDASGAASRLKLVVKSNPQGSRPGLRYNAASRLY